MKPKFISNILGGMKKSIDNFPIEVLIAFIITGISMYLVEISFDVEEYIFIRFIGALVLTLIYSICASLFVANQSYKSWIKYLIRIIPLLIGVGFYFYLPANEENLIGLHGIHYGIFSILGVLLIPAIRFINKKDDQISFWNSTINLIQSIIEAIIYSIVLGAGFSITVGAVDFLLGVDVSYKFYSRIWIVAFGCFGSMYFLGNLIKQLKEYKDFFYSKFLKILGLYILTTLLATYGIILYLYIIKIIFTQTWPEYGVARFVIAFCIAGMIAIKSITPLKEESKIVRTIIRVISVSSLPLIGLYFWAMGQRIFNYGITIPRYLGMSLGVWFLVCSIYFIISKKQQIKFALISLLPIILISSFGQWSAISTTFHSQKNLLEKQLIDNGFLVENKLIESKEETKIDYDLGRSIRGRLNILIDIYGIESIEEWLNETLKEKMKTETHFNAYDIVQNIGVGYYSTTYKTNRNYISIRTDNRNGLELKGYNKLYRTYLSSYRDGVKDKNMKDSKLELRIDHKKQNLIITHTNYKEEKSLNIIEIGKKINEVIGDGSVDINGTYEEVEFEDSKVGIYFESIYLTKDSSDDEYEIESLDLVILE